MTSKKTQFESTTATIKEWNDRCPVGTEVEFRLDSGYVRTTTTTPAEVYCLDSVVRLKNQFGFFSTSELMPISGGHARPVEYLKKIQSRGEGYVL